ncbi:hypothetical protein K437DRAFT_162455 [Tilletiaria anomala UBC 951]|uniref:BTB domain-containing protein n=1 Tax=Tilletiaria anomala (strain ATCC 24038 / CBS 436.72 / UBC 951) TaxID=1037660 RepID=A0A066WJI5_TILAU|nr:uncharacterized protein K437DRAFT_162455 [Tilletiaria anomala UBC 951]KDN52718.1 hypothetical protein K437DRAFT_162455 [Tilletiaria anomala UBC 951]
MPVRRFRSIPLIYPSMKFDGLMIAILALGAHRAVSVTFEWPLTGLRKIFDESKDNVKSKAIRSCSFGGGQWTVLLYAQSGVDQNVSLYLNAEPLASEKVHPLMTAVKNPAELERHVGTIKEGEQQSKAKQSSRTEWHREGVFRFTFSIYTAGKLSLISSKEALGHTFSSQTANWGWSGFCSRDRVYYNHHTVKEMDMFVVVVSLTKQPKAPDSHRPKGHIVSQSLTTAMGSLLDTPDYSDTIFVFPRQTRRQGKVIRSSGEKTKQIFAIKQILTARSDYFRDLFEGGFAEAEDSDDSEGFDQQDADQAANDSARAAVGDAGMRSLSPDHDDSDEGRDRRRAGSSARDTHQRQCSKKRRARARSSGTAGLDSSQAFAEADEELDYDGEGIFNDSDAEYELTMQDGETSDDASSVNTDEEERQGEDDHGDGPSQASDGDDLAAQQANYTSADPAAAIPSEDRHNTFTATLAVATPSYHSGFSHGKFSPPREPPADVPTFDDDEDEDMGHEDEIAAVSGGPGGAPGAGANINANANAKANANVNARAGVTPVLKTSDPAAERSIRAGSGDNTSEGTTKGLTNRMASLSTPSANARDANVAGTSGAGEMDKGKKRAADGDVSAERARKRNAFTGRKRRKVVIRDSYYPSFYALLYFLYTDIIEFAPLTSSYLELDDESDHAKSHTFDNPEEHLEDLICAHWRRADMICTYADRAEKAPLCSAKSIYKLADKMNLPELKKRAKAHIAGSLTVNNIVWEVFSSFTVRYPEIRKMEIDFLLEHFAEVKKTAAMKELFMRSVAHPGLAQVWPDLLSKLEYKKIEAEEAEAHASTSASE